MSSGTALASPPNAENPGTPAAGKPYTAPRRQIWSWGAGKVAEFSLVAMFGQAMNIFTVGFGLSPVLLSWCMMLPRLVDGIVDPIIGHWSDNTHTRWGRRKPFLAFGAVVGAFFLAILWWADPAWSHTTQLLFLGLIGMCLYLCYGTYTMAWNALGYELSDDYHERSRIQAVSGFFAAAMVLVNSWIYWLALRPAFGGVIWGMRWIGAMAAGLIVLSAMIVFFSTRERFTKANRTHSALLPAMRATLSNRPFVILMLIKLFEVFGGRLTGGVSFFLSVYYVCRGDQDLGTWIAGTAATLGAIWSFVVLPFVKPVSVWIGKRGALIAGAGFNFVAALAAPFLTTPEHPYWSLIPALVITPILTISALIASAILPDICDIDELENGQRREGLFTSVMAFVSKIEISLAVVLVGYVVGWSGVDTRIAQRWQDAALGKEVNEFSLGERAVFSFPENKPVTLDGFTFQGTAESIELFAGDETPTTGFRSIGVFSANGVEKQTFPAVTAKYIKVQLLGETDNVAVKNFSLLSGDENLLLTSRLAASEPPDRIGRRLYWLVMIPSIVFTGLTLLMTLLFPLTEKSMQSVRTQLDLRQRPAV